MTKGSFAVNGKRSDVFVSVVAVCVESSSEVSGFVANVQGFLASSYSNYEIVVVDNGLKPAELADLRKQLLTVPCVRVLRLSRKFAFDAAVFAGLEATIGDRVVVMNPSTDPVHVVSEVLELLRDSGADIVQGVSTVPIGQGLVSRIGRSMFYYYNKRFLDVDIPSRATYLTGLTRRAVHSLSATSRSHRYLRHLLRHVGYQIEEYSYLPSVPRHREHALLAGLGEGVEMISSYSTHPLRGMTALALLAALANVLYVVYVIVVQFVASSVVEGWTSTSLQVSLMFFAISLVLAVQSEYIGRILTETRREPDYIIMEEITSNILIPDEERRNVANG